MAYTNKRVYPLTKGTASTLNQGSNKFLNLGVLTLATPVDVTDFATVSGTVTDGTNPISGAYVSIKDSSSDITPLYLSTTSVTGAFSITVPQGSNYTVSVMSAGYATYTAVNTAANTPSVSLGTIALTSDSELQTNKKAILGKLKTGTEGNYTPVAGAFITLYDGSTSIGVTVSNANGEFAFIGLGTPTTGFNLKVTQANYATYSSDTISLSSTFNTISDIVLTAIVTNNSKLIQGTTTTNGTTVSPNAIVILYKVTGETTADPIAYTKSNANGYYSFVIPTPESGDTDTQYYIESTNNVVIS